jgi:predicted hotdog family 3-hydroxylacyl-ACP dehydratase
MNNYSITDVLPHRDPMVLIDSLESYDIDSCICQVKITNKSPFYNEKMAGVPSYIGNEYMAQAIAAYSGANALDSQHKVTIGFLLGSRKYKTFKPYFLLNTLLTIKVKQLYQEESGLSVFECEINDQTSNLIAQANINVFQPEDAAAFINENN